jgi:hypothetical protein
MTQLILMIVVVSAAVVYVDAKRIGARKGLIDGLANMTPVGWMLCTLFLWIVAVPLYLAKRDQIVRAAVRQDEALRSAGVASSLRKCPMCAELIQADAKICRYCRSEIR